MAGGSGSSGGGGAGAGPGSGPAGGGHGSFSGGDARATVGGASGGHSTQNTLAAFQGLKKYTDDLWTRARRERATREHKWRENRLVAEGEVYSVGESRKPHSPSEWRKGDGGLDHTEKLRVARQKCVAAKVALGDAIYKSERVPFLLSSAVGANLPPDAIEQIRSRVEEICRLGNAPTQKRLVIEDGASYGEGWEHGCVGVDPQGRPMGYTEAVSPWEMYFDEAGLQDLAKAEYVLRHRRLSPFEVANIVKGAPRIYDVEMIKTAMANAKPGTLTDTDAHAAETRTNTPLLDWVEFWARIPSSLLAPPGSAGVNDPQNAMEPGTATMDWSSVMIVTCADEIVAVVQNPGPTPYYRSTWDVDRMRALPQGIYDIMGATQECMTGAVRAWLHNLRESSRIVLAGKRDKVRQDAEQIIEGVKFIDVDPDCRTINEAITQFKIDAMTEGLTQAIDMLMEFADLESNIPRIQQGQQPLANSTAFEIRSRLAASGKYLNEIVRRHDGSICWSIGWIVYVMALSGEIDHESQVSVIARGFAQFADLVTRLDGLLQLLQLGTQNKAVDALLNHDEITREIAQGNDLDVGKVLLSPQEQAQRAQQEAQSQERQLALANAQADLATKQAKAQKDTAAASASTGKLQLDRAKFIHDVEQGSQGPSGSPKGFPVTPVSASGDGLPAGQG